MSQEGIKDEPVETLWNPKYAGLGILLIVLTIIVLDVLPQVVLSKAEQVTRPKDEGSLEDLLEKIQE